MCEFKRYFALHYTLVQSPYLCKFIFGRKVGLNFCNNYVIFLVMVMVNGREGVVQWFCPCTALERVNT